MTRIIKDTHKLQIVYPELSKEIDYEKNKQLGIDNNNISFGSNKKIWWICKNNHSFEASPANRTKGRGCPYCANKKILAGFNDLQTTDPKGAKEWDYEKNMQIGLEITKVSAISNKSAWWICPNGHSYKDEIVHHTKGLKCPYCDSTRKRLIVGCNDLETKDPEGAKEWDYDKNDISPNEVSYMSDKRAWWICPNGHSYDSQIKNHTIGYRCPYCAGQKRVSGENDLLTIDPEGAKEWDYNKNSQIDITKISPYSHTEVWWICPEGHSYKAAVKAHTDSKICPYCDYRIIEKGVNDLFTSNPELKEFWDYEENNKNKINSESINCKSTIKANWKCSKGHHFEREVKVFIKNKNCPFCNNSKVLPGFNDILTLDPEGAKEWDYDKNKQDITEINTNSNKLVWWICPKGHSYQQSMYKHTNGSRCPYCSSPPTKILVGYNDLGTIDPEGAKEWDYEKNNNLTPQDVFGKSGCYAYWKCPKGHSYIATVRHHTDGTRCPYCSGLKALKGFNDLLTLDPEGAKEWDYDKNKQDITTFTSGSGKNAWWICPNGHSYKMIIKSHYDGCRCPYCSTPPKKILSGFNDLATKDPEGIKEWDYDKNKQDPTKIFPNNRHAAWWICPNGHSYKMAITSHTQGNRCPHCAESKGENKIRNLLDNLKIQYEPQYTFDNLKNKRCLRYDFGIAIDKKLLFLIEYDGEQHYRPVNFGGISDKEAEREFKRTQKNDEIKNNYCKNNNIPLLRIPYWDFDKIEKILESELKKYGLI